MFTMIRIMIRPTAVPRMRPQPPVPTPVEAADNSEELKRGNPWKQELERLSQASDRSGRSRFGNLQAPSTAPEPTPDPVKQSMSDGTLSKLRAWWGAGLNSSNGAGASQQNRSYPPKKINRWQQ